MLVGWSLGGVVISNYLAAFGDGQIAGAVYVAGAIELKPALLVPHPDVYRDMTAEDLRTHLDGERTFLGLCFHTPPDATTFARLLANAALASWEMQRAVPTMTVDAPAGLGATRKPVLLLYGERDALVQAEPTIARAVEINPHAQSQCYAQSGHAPFLEEPERFNRDLAAFVDAAAEGYTEAISCAVRTSSWCRPAMSSISAREETCESWPRRLRPPSMPRV